MRKRVSKILVTGGAGFIGSAFVRLLVKQGYKAAVLDKLTYAGDLSRLAEVKGKFVFNKADICDKNSVERIFRKEKPDALVNFAAETHVDRSIREPKEFTQTNIYGAQVLLDAARKFSLDRFVHISTDEVYGDIAKGKFREDSSLRPNSPYAASKAAVDLFIRAYQRTYGLPCIIVRPSNNFGHWQYPEKFIPLSILKVLKGGKIPVYGKGLNVREWLFVEDCAEGVFRVLERGKLGEIYNLGSGQEYKNIEVAGLILKLLGKDNRHLEFVKDRLGHDLRYSLDSNKIRRELDWRARTEFKSALENTVSWYLTHKGWFIGKWKNIATLYK